MRSFLLQTLQVMHHLLHHLSRLRFYEADGFLEVWNIGR
jgi:hypothetical protein